MSQYDWDLLFCLCMLIYVAVIETMTDGHCYNDHFCYYCITVFYDVVIITMIGGHYFTLTNNFYIV